MTSIRFNPISDLILLSMKVEGVDKSEFLSQEELLILSLMMVMNGLHFKLFALKK